MSILDLKPEEILAWCARTEHMSEELLAVAGELMRSIEYLERSTPFGSYESQTVEWQLDEVLPILNKLHENIHRLCETTLNSIAPILTPTLNDLILE